MAEQEQPNQAKKSFTSNLLSPDKKALFDFYQTRKQELIDAKKDHYGTNLNDLFAEADKAYIPHRYGSAGREVLVEDENKGWRGQPASSKVKLGSNDWQSDIAQPNPFIKIQTALAILVDQNPSGVFTPTLKKFQATTILIERLYERSWEYARSKSQLVLFIFNMAKYGWGTGRSYPLKVTRKVRVLKEFNEKDPDKNVYEEQEIVEYNDIYRENLDPRNVWIDDQAKPNNPMSIKDWMWRKVYDFDVAKEEFGKYKLWDYVTPGGNVAETIDSSSSGKQKEVRTRNLVEIFFYENRIKDVFIVEVNGVPVIIEPLPVADAKGVKKLTLWQSYWMLRHAESPYGIGIYEAIRYDNALKDRLRNMTIDQVTLAIYKMFFYQGTQALTETGDITISPGVGKQTLDPKNIAWLDIKGPDPSAWEALEMLQKDVDEASAITETLLGEVTGKTAFEIAQAKESALKRLKTPLNNITEALNTEGYLTVSLMQMLYSVPETYQITDPELIDAYLKEIQGDKELFEREETTDEMGNPQQVFNAKVYPEFPLNLDKDEAGNLIETEDTKFFRLKPKSLQWEGLINIKSQSLLSPSKQLDKALNLEFYNALGPLMAQLVQERALASQVGEPATLDALPHGKMAIQLCKDYDKDPKDIFPDFWFEEKEEPLIIPVEQAQQQQMQQEMGGMPQPGAVPKSAAVEQQPKSLVQTLMSKMSAPFRKV